MEQQIIKTEYSDIMRKSYIDYAMSVIVARALPDARDGLKPVQRRTLYDMYELGIRYDRPYRKCARIVGDTMGKYHPHGDASIYDALVVMAQDFKKGLPLIDGHGNFGSIEGDGAAAMRYTEARLQKVTQMAYLSDLDKNVVDFVPNFDETEQEPAVLPVRIPNLLVNGAEGIAVGMATNIPPHNLGEVVDAAIAYLKNPNISLERLMKLIQGPDFPTGGVVTNQEDLLEIYRTGTGKIKIRGQIEVEKAKGGRQKLVIKDIPYTMMGANIGKFLNDVYSLVETKKTNDIVDIVNESSKEGIRIVLELRRGADVEHLTNMLYKKTKLQDTFGVNMLAVANGRPETMGLKEILEHYADFQYDLATRKYNYLLDREMEKKEIQEGLIEACNVIDLIIEILRGSANIQDVRACLTTGRTDGIQFKSQESKEQAAGLHFTEKQATAILEMRLYKLIGLEIEALQREHDETLRKIASYLDILNSHSAMNEVLISELRSIKKEFAAPRKTHISNIADVVYEEKKIEEMPVIFVMDRFGYAKTIDVATFERNIETVTKEYRYVLKVMNTGFVGIFTNTGFLHRIKIQDLPAGKLKDKGTPIDNVSHYDSGTESVLSVESMSGLPDSQLLFVTRHGFVKLVDGAEFQVAKRTVAASKLSENDELLLVSKVSGTEHVVLQSEGGYFLRFPLSEIPAKKKTAIGVRGMKLGDKDSLQAAYVLTDSDVVVTYKERQVHINRLQISKRDNKGVKR